MREATTVIEAVKSRKNRHRQQKPQKPVGNGTAGASPKPFKCTRCGRLPPHGRPQCPANEAVCHKCHKRGHFNQCCKSKVAIKEVTQDSEEEPFLGTVTADAVGANTPWIVNVQLNGQKLEFKVDTGADVTVVLTCLKEAGLTLGLAKCEINKNSVKFLSLLVDETGVRPDPDKVRAIQQMKPPTTVR